MLCWTEATCARYGWRWASTSSCCRSSREASLLAPVYLQALVGAVVPVDVREVLKTVALVVALPMVAGAVTRIGVVRARGEAFFRGQVVPALPGLSTLGVLGIVFVAIALVYGTVIRNLSIALGIAVTQFGPAEPAEPAAAHPSAA